MKYGSDHYFNFQYSFIEKATSKDHFFKFIQGVFESDKDKVELFFKEHSEEFSIGCAKIESCFEVNMEKVFESKEEMADNIYVNKMNGIVRQRDGDLQVFFKSFIEVHCSQMWRSVCEVTLTGKVKRQVIKMLFMPRYLEFLARKDREEAQKALKPIAHARLVK